MLLEMSGALVGKLPKEGKTHIKALSSRDLWLRCNRSRGTSQRSGRGKSSGTESKRPLFTLFTNSIHLKTVRYPILPKFGAGPMQGKQRRSTKRQRRCNGFDFRTIVGGRSTREPNLAASYLATSPLLPA